MFYQLDLHKISKIIYILFVFVVLVDPTNTIFHLKDLLFIVCMIFGCINNSNVLKLTLYFIISFFVIVLYGILIALITQTVIDYEYLTSFLRTSFFLFIVISLQKYSTEFLIKINRRLSLIISFAVCFVFMLYFIFPQLFTAVYIYSMAKNNTIIFSIRQYLGIQFIALFYKTIPICFFSLIYYLSNIKSVKNVCLGFVVFLSIFLSGSRTPMLCGLVILLISLSQYIPRKMQLVKYFSFFVISMGILSLIYVLAAEKDEPSNITKYATLNDYIQEFSQVNTLVLGEGVGSLFYSTGRRDLVPHTELTYLEVIRMFGLPVGSILIFILFVPVLGYYISDKSELKDFFIAYFFYMIMAGSNPLVFSSTGMYVFSLGIVIFIRVLDEYQKNRNIISNV